MGVLLVNATSTLLMVGLIWTVQVVHYPLFAAVGERAFPAYEAEHKRRMTLALALPWPVEVLSSAWLVVSRPADVPAVLAWSGLLLVGVTVALTVAVAVPLHGRLDGGFDRQAHRRLVTTNWLRTGAWVAHGGVVVAMLAVV